MIKERYEGKVPFVLLQNAQIYVCISIVFFRATLSHFELFKNIKHSSISRLYRGGARIVPSLLIDTPPHFIDRPLSR